MAKNIIICCDGTSVPSGFHREYNEKINLLSKTSMNTINRDNKSKQNLNKQLKSELSGKEIKTLDFDLKLEYEKIR